LVEGQEKNMVQLKRIRATMEWRWGLEREDRKEESRDDVERSKNGPRESQKRETP